MAHFDSRSRNMLEQHISNAGKIPTAKMQLFWPTWNLKSLAFKCLKVVNGQFCQPL